MKIQINQNIFIPAILLTFISIVTLYPLYLSQDIGFVKLYKQIFFIFLGIILYLLLQLVDINKIKGYSYFLYILGLLLLISVLIFGTEIRGTKAWFDFKILKFQPSEIVRIFFIIAFAKFLSDFYYKWSDIKKLFLSFLFLSPLIFLIFLESDLGALVLVGLIYLGMLFSAGISKRTILILLILLIIISNILWFFIFKPYHKQRIITFLNPQKDPKGAGYNIIQSKITIGSGGIFGGDVSQIRLKFLPEQDTDFIFATFCEQYGFLGALFLLTLYFIFLKNIISQIIISKDFFKNLLFIGIFLNFWIQIAINIGMNLGILPVIGVPLVFISYGGSNMIASFLAISFIRK